MSRRTEIADAGIAALATHGMRGLTHRAVDREAGLAEGSTSYYFRTRQALLRGIFERLLEMDLAELPALRIASLDDLVEELGRLVEMLLTAGRDRLLARYEFYLESNRRPELRELVMTGGSAVRAAIAEQLGAIGISEPERRAWNFAAFLDGFMFDQVAGVSAGTAGAEEVRAALRTLATAALAPTP
jgi:DNA-binding transcriptional regulator YbjK